MPSAQLSTSRASPSVEDSPCNPVQTPNGRIKFELPSSAIRATLKLFSHEASQRSDANVFDQASHAFIAKIPSWKLHVLSKDMAQPNQIRFGIIGNIKKDYSMKKRGV